MSFATRRVRFANWLEASGADIRANGVPLPMPPEPLIDPDLSPNGDVAGQGANGDTIYLLRAGALAWEPVTTGAVGKWPCAFDYQDRLVWQQLAFGGRRRAIDGGVPETISPWTYMSGGIRDIEPTTTEEVDGVTRLLEGPIRMIGEPGLSFTRRDGSIVTLVNWTYRNGTYVSYADRGTTLGDGIVTYRPATDALKRVWRGNPQNFPPRLSDDGTVVALSGDLDRGFFPEAAWTDEPAAAPVPAPSEFPPLETVVPCVRMMSRLVVCWSWHVTEPVGNAVIPIDPTPAELQAIVQGGRQLYLQLKHAAMTHPDNVAAYVLELEGQMDRLQAIRDARAIANPVCTPLYIAAPSFTDDEIDRFEAGDVAAPYLVPREGESPDAYFTRGVALANYYLERLPVGVVLALLFFLVERYEDHTGRVVVGAPELAQLTVAASRIIAADNDVDISIFRMGLSDEQPQVKPYLARWIEGVPAPPPYRRPTPNPNPTPDPDPDPEPDDMPVMTDPERDAMFDTLLPVMQRLYPRITDLRQALREANDAFREESQDKYDGTPVEWRTIIEMRANGAPLDDRKVFVRGVLRLRR